MARHRNLLLVVPLVGLTLAGCARSATTVTRPAPAPDTSAIYRVVDTGQIACYDSASAISSPSPGQPYFGQDAQFAGTQPSYTVTGSGSTAVVTDNNTGLTWQRMPSTQKYSWASAMAYPATLNAQNFAGHSDWRVPTIKELYSLWNGSSGWPYIDTGFFDCPLDPMMAKATQYWSSTEYVGLLGGTTRIAFGVNFATGHIKAYPLNGMNYIRCVRGGSYGINRFQNNDDGTVSDQATGLIWDREDSGVGMDWKAALQWAQTKNASNHRGHNDWRLPNAKELQSLVDYTRSPGATEAAHVGPAIDPLFRCTPITNEAGLPDYPYYWTSTSSYFLQGVPDYYYAWYVAFGSAVDGTGADYHGAGAVRFDSKSTGGPGGEGAERITNYVRLVR